MRTKLFIARAVLALAGLSLLGAVVAITCALPLVDRLCELGSIVFMGLVVWALLAVTDDRS